ncbi:MAG: hypothetical protein BWY82_00879 [Verrucomicrobia bacterium ADurb.Bin474]|nr:MAG: hypothetical protein BWY82_00879 [Verrucomicrobia bacterium ADurb.Bin474]
MGVVEIQFLPWRLSYISISHGEYHHFGQRVDLFVSSGLVETHRIGVYIPVNGHPPDVIHIVFQEPIAEVQQFHALRIALFTIGVKRCCGGIEGV